ncbi:MAG: ArsR family transcriptional regulator [Deltaproteobacteria bacterium]|nr:MAG: ArsR family transcriptional regulator [Deltaproteobacteria bacterium]
MVVEASVSSWTFLSNHAHVLLLLCEDPDLRMRDIAEKVDITERAVQRIVHDLVEEGYIAVRKEGRRNHYSPNLKAHLRHPIEERVTIGALAALIS